jgi:hypothetical protein
VHVTVLYLSGSDPRCHRLVLIPREPLAMAEITRADYSTSKTSTFGEMYHIWHDSLSVGAVTGLTGNPRSHSIRMLIFGVQNGDGHPSQPWAKLPLSPISARH